MYLQKLWYIIFPWQIESLYEPHLLEIEIFHNIINVFTVPFEQFNVSLLN